MQLTRSKKERTAMSSKLFAAALAAILILALFQGSNAFAYDIRGNANYTGMQNAGSPAELNNFYRGCLSACNTSIADVEKKADELSDCKKQCQGAYSAREKVLKGPPAPPIPPPVTKTPPTPPVVTKTPVHKPVKAGADPCKGVKCNANETCDKDGKCVSNCPPAPECPACAECKACQECKTCPECPACPTFGVMLKCWWLVFIILLVAIAGGTFAGYMFGKSRK